MPLQLNHITEKIIGAAIEVHKHTGPGLLESSYEMCLAREFQLQELSFKRQVDLPVQYKGIQLDSGYRMDFVVSENIVLEIKSIEKILPIHEAQLLTYLKLSNKPIGLLINFNVPRLIDGICRRVI